MIGLGLGLWGAALRGGPRLGAYSNLLTWSEAFDNAAWTKAGTALTVTADASQGGDGTTTADRVSGSAASQSLQQIVTSTSGDAHGLSLHVANSDRGIITLRAASGTNDVRKRINLATGAVVDGGGNGVGFLSAGVWGQVNGLYRIFLLFTSGGTSITCNLYPDDNSLARTHTADFWGAQLVKAADIGTYAKRTT